MNKIIFHSHREYNSYIKDFNPEPSAKIMPEWYTKASKYIKDPNTGKDIINYDGARTPSFKACPAVLDLFSTGYMMKTPCDLLFYEKNKLIYVKSPKGYEDFCGTRPKMPEFVSPYGYYEEPFHWYAPWAPELPNGYSAIYLNPVNHFDLPFYTVGGIIDNDKFNTPGLMPFFLKEGFLGVLPAGTPFIQIIPFKREDWESEIKLHNQEEILERFMKSSNSFRTINGGEYKKKFWSRRKYK